MPQALLALLLASTTALAAPGAFQVPSGARWAVIAPSAGTFATETSKLLTAAGAHAPTLTPRRFNNELVRATGVGLLSVDELRDRGIDLDSPWMAFERGAARYLLVSVKSPALTGSLEGWAAGRLLKTRAEHELTSPAGRFVSFARAAGTKPASAYLATADRVLIVLRGEVKEDDAAAALKAVDAAAPVKPGVEGTALVYVAGGRGLTDTWIGLQARPDGLDANAIARKVDAGWVDRAEARSAWLRELTASPQGDAPGDLPLRLRMNGGSQLAQALAGWLGDLGVEPALQAWLREAGTLAKGPVEALVSGFDLRSPPSLARGLTADVLTRLVHLQLSLPEAGASDVLKRAKALPSAKAQGQSLALPVASQILTILRDGRAAHAMLDAAGRAPEPFPSPPGAPSLACAKGTPAASARVHPGLLEDALGSVGFFAAMKNDVLLGAYGIHTEFGALLAALRPIVALACVEPSGRATATARLRLVAAAAPARAP